MIGQYVLGLVVVIVGILMIVFRRALGEPGEFLFFQVTARNARAARPVILFGGVALIVLGTLILAGVGTGE